MARQLIPMIRCAVVPSCSIKVTSLQVFFYCKLSSKHHGQRAQNIANRVLRIFTQHLSKGQRTTCSNDLPLESEHHSKYLWSWLQKDREKSCILTYQIVSCCCTIAYSNPCDPPGFGLRKTLSIYDKNLFNLRISIVFQKPILDIA